jgi:TMEM175 potassium channel family protein
MSAPNARPLSPARLSALTDGIFAIAMTLLVLNLAVPELPAATAAAQLPHALLALWPKLLSYALSFVVVGVYWVGQHNQFHFLRWVDRPFLWLNLLFLLAVCTIPFSAALLGAYMWVPLAVAIYGLNLAAVGAVLYAIWRYATDGHRLVDPNLPPQAIRIAGRRVAIGVVVYLAAVGVAAFDSWVSVAIYVAMPLYYIVPGRIDRHFGRDAAPDHAPSSDVAARD